MKIINKYVLREHLGPFGFALAALTSLLLLNYVAKQFGKLVGKGLGWDVIGEFFLLSIPFTVAMTLPMAVLVATLYAFSRLAAESEITAFRASGVSMRRLITPVVLAAAGVTVFMIFFNDQVLPRSNARLSTLQSDILRTKPTFALTEKVTTRVGEGQLWIYAGRLPPSGPMRDVVIYDLSQPSRPLTIYADSGTLNFAPNRRDLLLRLHEGHVQEFPRDNPDQLQRTFFTNDVVVVRDVANQMERSEGGQPRTDRERTVCELQEVYNTNAQEYARAYEEAVELRPLVLAEGGQADLPPRQTTYTRTGLGALYCRMLASFGAQTAIAAEPPGQDGAGGGPVVQDDGGAAASSGSTARRPIPPSAGGAQALYDLAALRAQAAWRSMNQYDVEIHKKFALAVACIVFVLLGAPIALRFPRGGVGVVIGVSLVVFALYYVGLIAGETMADEGYLPPYIAMWAANILFTALAVVLLLRMGRQGTTTRGGDLGELLDTLRRGAAAIGRRLGLPLDRREQVAP